MNEMPEVRLIDANALAESDMAKIIDNYLYSQCNLTVGFAAALMPEIEAEPVRHGRWIKQENGMNVCSVCGVTRVSHFPFCGNCGARMDADHIADVSKKVGGTDNDDSM